MDHYVGIDVSLELGSLCVPDATDRIVREAKIAIALEALLPRCDVPVVVRSEYEHAQSQRLAHSSPFDSMKKRTADDQ